MSFAPEHRIIAAFVVGQISQEKADQLIRRTKAVNDGSLHVFFSDQRPQYEDAILKHFGRWRIFPRTGKPGRPRKPHLEPHPNLIYAQVVKHRRQGKVVKVTERLIFGTEKALQEYLERSPVSHRINTSVTLVWVSVAMKPPTIPPNTMPIKVAIEGFIQIDQKRTIQGSQ